MKGYASIPELMLGLAEYFMYYNTERSHQSLGYQTPDRVYETATGGGAMIVDKYPRRTTDKTEEIESKTGQRRSAALDGLPS